MRYCLWVILLLSTIVFGESPEYQALLDSAIFQLNNNEYQLSIENFQRIIDNDENAIFAQLGLLQATRFEMIEAVGYAYDKSVLFEKSNSLVSFYEKKLETDPSEPDLHFCMAMAIGFKLRAVLGEKNSFYILYNGLKAIKHIRRCDDLEKENPDVEFSKGLFEYYVSQYPGIVKYFSNLVLENTGDREIGIQRMNKTAKSEAFLNVDANYTLAFLYLFIENQPAQAIPYINYLTENFPKNPGFHFMATFTYLQLNDIVSAQIRYSTYKNSLQWNRNFYVEEYKCRTHFLEGLFAIKEGNLETARAKLEQFSQNYNLELEHLLAIADLELGKIADINGNRNIAINYYKKTIKIDNRTYPVELAKKFKITPYYSDF